MTEQLYTLRMLRLLILAICFTSVACNPDWTPPDIEFSVSCENTENGESRHFFELTSQDLLDYAKVEISTYPNFHNSESHELQEISYENDTQTWQLELSFTEQSDITPNQTTHFRCEDQRITIFEVKSGRYTLQVDQKNLEIDEATT